MTSLLRHLQQVTTRKNYEVSLNSVATSNQEKITSSDSLDPISSISSIELVYLVKNVNLD